MSKSKFDTKDHNHENNTENILQIYKSKLILGLKKNGKFMIYNFAYK